MITIFINDAIKQVEQGASLTKVLEQYSLENDIQLAAIAVAINNCVAPRATWHTTQCQANDKLELFSVVAGG